MDIDAAVDDLLVMTQRQPQLSTDTYDSRFFAIRNGRAVTADECMEEASLGLAHFIKEAEAALKTNQLTVDQRLHVAMLVSYVDGLATRFDKVREPGYVEKPKSLRQGT